METTYDLLIEKLSRQAGSNSIPLNGAFELTSRCNFNCKMCYVHNENNNSTNKNELTMDQWIQLATEARDAGMLNLVLTGGEIFLRSDIEEIYEALATMGFKITLFTNGSLIDRKRAKWLGRIPPTSMEITLYGASAETYDKLCGNASGYEQTVNAIDLLLDEGINLGLKTTITYLNMHDYEQLAEFSFKRGIPLNIVKYLYPATKSAIDCRLTPEDLVDFEARFQATSNRLRALYSKGDVSEESVKYAKKIVQDMKAIPGDHRSRVSAFNCKAGSSGFWITWDGRMLPCGVMDKPVIYPLETGIKIAWDCISKHCESISVCKECAGCDMKKWCLVCPAKLKNETGYYDRPAEYICKLTRLSKERLLEDDESILFNSK